MFQNKEQYAKPCINPPHTSLRHHHVRLLLRIHLLLPELRGRLLPALLLPRPLLLPPRDLPDHRVPPRDLRAPLHAPHLRALPPPSVLRPLLPAGRLLPPHHLLPHVVHLCGLQALLLDHHLLPACVSAVPLLPAPLRPAGPLQHHLQDLLLLLRPHLSQQHTNVSRCTESCRLLHPFWIR
ncbi:hypothetical protein P7K49_010525 [Saguinus oedipus]|uniref:Uncharacterized protein n=1 Tax=Saguinus oedipus TaxID=9490 RepID=A0ABQ9VN36_SAGOE|nr:hypothetical protein P7K49_010525 [Saguinus oedipus]